MTVYINESECLLRVAQINMQEIMITLLKCIETGHMLLTRYVENLSIIKPLVEKNRKNEKETRSRINEGLPTMIKYKGIL